MINYSEVNILDVEVKKCLTFDPFRLEKNNKLSINNIIDLKQKNLDEIKQIQFNYYNCSMNCFELYENISILNYHYELSCLCIKNCFEQINKIDK